MLRISLLTGHEALAQLPIETVGTPSREVLKARLDGALGSLIWWVAAVTMTGVWNWVSFKILFNSNHSLLLCCTPYL